MKLRVLATALALAVALTACATRGRLEEVLASWVGSPESAIVSAWGPPASVYESPDGARILTYNRSGSFYMPGTAASYQSTRVGNTVYTNQTGGSPAYNIPYYCTMNFTVLGGVISRWSYQGNNCVSR